jgi:hypothetical protein
MTRLRSLLLTLAYLCVSLSLAVWLLAMGIPALAVAFVLVALGAVYGAFMGVGGL